MVRYYLFYIFGVLTFYSLHLSSNKRLYLEQSNQCLVQQSNLLLSDHFNKGRLFCEKTKWRENWQETKVVGSLIQTMTVLSNFKFEKLLPFFITTASRTLRICYHCYGTVSQMYLQTGHYFVPSQLGSFLIYYFKINYILVIWLYVYGLLTKIR